MVFRFARGIVAAGSIAAFLYLHPSLVAADALPIPEGTFEYSLTQNSAVVGTSSVTIHRSGSVVQIHESETVTQTKLGPVQAAAELQVGAATLIPLMFSGQTQSSGKTADVRLTMNGTTGAFVREGSSSSIPVGMLPGTQAMVVQDQALVCSFVLIPALSRLPNASALTLVVPTAARSFVMTFDPLAPAKSGTVPAKDSGVQVASPVAFAVWFDPRSGVVDEVDVPSQALVIQLTKQH